MEAFGQQIKEAWLSSCICRLRELQSIYDYQGEQTCAADGMCQVKCPVKINTGEMVKTLRAERYDEGTTRASRVSMVRAGGACCAQLPHGHAGASLCAASIGGTWKGQH